jgi:hypothetical protein
MGDCKMEDWDVHSIMQVCRVQGVDVTSEMATDLLRTLEDDGYVEIGDTVIHQTEYGTDVTLGDPDKATRLGEHYLEGE